MSLPTDNTERKALPVFTFLTKYFPLAFLEVVRVAVDGDKQHGNTGVEIQWAREKSTDQLNTALRHLIDYGMGRKLDTDGRAHLAKAIWRLSAQLQLDEEAKDPMNMTATEIERASGWAPIEKFASGTSETLTTEKAADFVKRAVTFYQENLPVSDYLKGSGQGTLLTATEERIRQEHRLTENCVFVRNRQFCTLGRSHEGPHSFDLPATLPLSNYCGDCDADLDEQDHDPTCLRR